MKRTTQFFGTWMSVFLLFTGYGLAQPPVPISPGADQESGEYPNHVLAPMGVEGTSNTFYGHEAGNSTSGDRGATFIGAYAGYHNTSGDYNTFLGYNAGKSNTTGGLNTFLGLFAGYSNTTGYYNTFVGHAAGYFNAGTANTFLGRLAGYNNTTGSLNVFIGYQAGYNDEGSNRLYIHNSDTDNPLIYGEFNNNIVKIHGQLQMLSAATLSDSRLKRNIQPLESSLEKVLELQGVSYNWNTEQYPDWGFKDTKQIGLVAQDVEAVIPELVSADTKGYKAVSYNKLTAVLVEAVKELKAENENLKSQLDELRALIKGLKG